MQLLRKAAKNPVPRRIRLRQPLINDYIRSKIPAAPMPVPTHNRLDEAEAAYRKAIEINPKWATPWRALGDLLGSKLNRLEEAEAAYRKAIEINPKWATPWRALGDLLGSKLNRLDEAESAYRKAIEINPKWATPWRALGDLLGSKLNRLDEAESAYRKAIALNPELVTSWGALGDLLGTKLNRLDEAEAAYHKVIELDPKWAGPWDALGDLLGHRLNRLNDAEAAYRKAIALSPEWATPWISLGNLLQDRMKRFAEAEEAYRTAIEVEGAHPITVANLARLLARTGRNDEASELFRESLKLAREDDHNLRLQAHCWLGNGDLSMQSLDALSALAAKSNARAFYQLKEQCFECHAIGLSKPLVDLMERSRFADFLTPFALALRAASGEKEALLDAAVEVRGMAEEVLSQINAGG